MKLSCKQNTLLISKSQDQPLSAKENVQVFLHNLSCSPCRRFQKQMKTLKMLFIKLKDDEIINHLQLQEEKRQEMEELIRKESLGHQ